jgi:uncharacterized damage-inducible protein DinB
VAGASSARRSKAFLDAWTNEPYSFCGDYSHTTLVQELDSVRALYPRCRGFLETLDSTRHAEPLIVPWSKWAEQLLGRPPGPTTLGETILQMLTHSTHHRAQANARLRTLGAQPPVIDYIAWLWMERPKPAWPAAAAL